MSNRIGNKTPAQTHNDLFYLNNSNDGLDTTLRSVYSGNGKETKLKLSETKCQINFNKGMCQKPVLDAYHLKTSNIGSVPGTYEIKTALGNLQKVQISDNTTFSIASDMDANIGTELTVLVEQTAANKTISFTGNVKTPEGTSISLSAVANAVDVIKLITIDAGNTWYAFKLATELR